VNFPSRGRLSIERARQDFGYNPEIGVEQGFTRYLTWLQYSKFWRKRIYG